MASAVVAAFDAAVGAAPKPARLLVNIVGSEDG
jgi:hypothetical protein